MSWKKVEASQSQAWNPETQSEISGIYKEMRTKVGPNESNLYIFKQENGEDIAVWGNTVIDSRMKEVELGSEVKIVFLGEEKSEKTGRTYKNFEVYVREAE